MMLWSFTLDGIFLFRIKGLLVKDKICFIFSKYAAYIRFAIFGLRKGELLSSKVFGRRFYYDDGFGLASLQRVYCESYKLKELVGEDAVVIDVGAHIGQFNFFCRQYLKARRVLSVEPLEGCFEVLKLNAEKPEDCVNSAVSKEDGRVTFYISEMSSQQSSYVKDEKERYSESVSVPSTRLDTLMNAMDVSKCALLKIDTEGSEYDVLQSAAKELYKVDLLLVEMSVYRASAGNLFTTGSFLQHNHFKLVKLLPASGDLTFLDGIFKRTEP